MIFPLCVYGHRTLEIMKINKMRKDLEASSKGDHIKVKRYIHELQNFSHQAHDMDFLVAVLSPNTFSVLSG